MNKRARYSIAQVLAVPCVAVPALVGGSLLAGLIYNAFAIHALIRE